MLVASEHISPSCYKLSLVELHLLLQPFPPVRHPFGVLHSLQLEFTHHSVGSASRDWRSRRPIHDFLGAPQPTSGGLGDEWLMPTGIKDYDLGTVKNVVEMFEEMRDPNKATESCDQTLPRVSVITPRKTYAAT